jgi:hypothetical protein
MFHCVDFPPVDEGACAEKNTAARTNDHAKTVRMRSIRLARGRHGQQIAAATETITASGTRKVIAEREKR